MQRPNQETKLRKPKIRQIRKTKKRHLRKNKIDEKVEMVAPPQLELISFKLKKGERKSNIISRALREIFLKPSVITVIKNIITPEITSNQKTSYGFDNLYVDNF